LSYRSNIRVLAFAACGIAQCSLAAFSFCIGATVVQPAQAAAIDISVNRRDDGIGIRASALLKSDIATAWRVLTDYDRYVDFIPGLRSSHTERRSGSTATVEQSGEAMIWLLRAPIDVTYAITEFPPTRLESRTIAGCACRLTSTYSLTRSGSNVLLGYMGRLEMAPAAFASIRQAAAKQTIIRQFQALADEIELRANDGSGLVSAPGAVK